MVPNVGLHVLARPALLVSEGLLHESIQEAGTQGAKPTPWVEREGAENPARGLAGGLALCDLAVFFVCFAA